MVKNEIICRNEIESIDYEERNMDRVRRARISLAALFRPSPRIQSPPRGTDDQEMHQSGIYLNNETTTDIDTYTSMTYHVRK